MQNSELMAAPSPSDAADMPGFADDEPAQQPGSIDVYAQILGTYFTNREEKALYRASLLSRQFIEEGLGPEEIIAIHAEAVEIASSGLSYREKARAATDALQFLLEMMIAYGVQYRAYLDLRLRERDRETEARLELERQRVADAEQSEREKQDILATISHELRTPITAALGNVDLARRSLERQQVERLPARLGAAREALGRLARLTDELIGASKDGLPAMVMRPIDAGQVLRKAVAWAKTMADEKGISLVSVDPGGCGAVADADALLTIFSNLLTNAIRYTPEGGRVEARCGVDDVGVWFRIVDTGIGMAPATRARIFEKFYRAPDAKVAEPRGLGLGLSIAQRLIAVHRGNLSVESAPGEGSTFEVRLPRDVAASDEDTGGSDE
ncbi:MAG: ATP-binding protein [Chloroflexota bacterium]